MRMATLSIEGGQLVVRLSLLEQFAASRRRVQVPLTAVRSVTREAGPWPTLRGLRAPGTGAPGLMAYGARRWTGDRSDFAAVLRGRPTVRVDLDSPSPFARLLISVPDADAAIAMIKAAAAK
jgi:hypothetical protein